MNGVVMQIERMKHPRGRADAVTLKDNIYVVGGQGDWREDKPVYTIHNDGECYDPNANVWHDLPPMASGRYSCTVETIGGSLYCVGGYDDISPLKTVERCDPRADITWQQVTTHSAHPPWFLM
jgi:kelch-like protein 8